MAKIVFTGTSLRLMEGKRELARASYHETAAKIIQVVELNVDAEYRRRGHGSALLKAIVSAVKPDKVWMAVAHKNHIIARAFLTKHGFHHISTTSNLLRDEEDLLIYVKSWI